MRSRERLAGFCFQFAQTDFFCVCVFLLFLEIHCRQALPAEIVIFKGKIPCKGVLSLSVSPVLPVPGPAMPPPYRVTPLPLQCSTNWGHSGAALSLVGGQGVGFGQEQARGWVSPALVGQGCADSPALAEAAPDVSPAAHLWLSPSQQQMLPAWAQPASTPHFRTDRLHQAGTSGDICCSLARHLLVLSPQ